MRSISKRRKDKTGQVKTRQTAADECPGMGVRGIEQVNDLGTAESRQLHQLLSREGPRHRHQLRVDLQGLRGGNEPHHGDGKQEGRRKEE